MSKTCNPPSCLMDSLILTLPCTVSFHTTAFVLEAIRKDSSTSAREDCPANKEVIMYITTAKT